MTLMQARFGIMLAAIAVLSIVSTGCADKLTYSRFSDIQVKHSNKADVRYLIGRPDFRTDYTWEYKRTDPIIQVFIDFDSAGFVERKQWIDPVRWIDTEEPEESDDGVVYESTTIRQMQS